MFQSIEFVDILQHPVLYIRLSILLLRSCNPENPDDFQFAYRILSNIYGLEFLN